MNLPNHLKLFISGSLITIGGNMVLGLINYLVRRTMAERLSATDYGCFFGAFSLLAILLAFLDLGMVNAGTILIAEEHEKNGEIFSLLFFLKMILGLTAAVIIFLLRNVIADHYLGGTGAAMTGVLAFFVLFNALDGTFVSYYCGHKFYQTGNIFRCSIAFLLLMLVFSLSRTFAAVGAAAAYVLAYVVFCPIQLFWICRNGKFRLTTKISPYTGKRLLALIGILAVITCMQTLLFNMDSVMLTLMCGPEATAVYNIALPITQLLLSVLVFASVFLPMAVDMVGQKRYDRLRRYVGGALFCTLAVLPCVFWGSRWCGGFLIALFFKSSYSYSAAPVLPWLMSGYLLFSFGSFVTQILIAMRRMTLLLSISTATVACNFALNCLLIQLYGASGAAMATFFAYALFAALTLAAFVRKSESSGIMEIHHV